MKALFFANKLSHAVKIRPLTEARVDITRVRLALDLRKPLGDFSDLTLWWRALRVAMRGASSLTDLRYTIPAVALGLFRTAKLLESYATQELTQLFRITQIPGAYERDNPTLAASGLDLTYADQRLSWDADTTSELVNFAPDNSGPSPSAHEVVDIAVRLANMPVRAAPQGWFYNELDPAQMTDCFDAVFVARLLEQVRYKLAHQEVALEAAASATGSIPDRAALLRTCAADLMSIPLSGLKMYGEHLQAWISHPYTAPYLALGLRDRYERVASEFAFSSAPVNVTNPWANLTPIASRPLAESAPLDMAIWNVLQSHKMGPNRVTPPDAGTKRFVPVRAGQGLAFVSDRSYAAINVPPAAHTAWLDAFSSIAGEMGRLLASVTGLDLSAAGAAFLALNDFVPQGEVINAESTNQAVAWVGTSSGMPVTSSEMYFAMLTTEEGEPALDPAALVTYEKLRDAYKRAPGTGVLNFVGATEVDERRKDYDDRLLVPMTANDLLRDAVHAAKTLDGLLTLWGRTKALWQMEAAALDLSTPLSPSLRQLATALRFLGVLELEFVPPTPEKGAPPPKWATLVIPPRQQHWYHADFHTVKRYLDVDPSHVVELARGADRPPEVILTSAGFQAQDAAAISNKAREVRLVLRPFTHVPSTSATRAAPGNLGRVPLAMLRRDSAAVTWIARGDATFPSALGVPSVCPAITAWAKPMSPISDVHLLFRYETSQGDGRAKFAIHGDGVAARWAARKNGLVQLIGTGDVEAIPGDMLTGRNSDEPTDDVAAWTGWSAPDGAMENTPRLIINEDVSITRD